jgi:hypothetical protein
VEAVEEEELGLDVSDEVKVADLQKRKSALQGALDGHLQHRKKAWGKGTATAIAEAEAAVKAVEEEELGLDVSDEVKVADLQKRKGALQSALDGHLQHRKKKYGKGTATEIAEAKAAVEAVEEEELGLDVSDEVKVVDLKKRKSALQSALDGHLQHPKKAWGNKKKKGPTKEERIQAAAAVQQKEFNARNMHRQGTTP